MQYSIREASSTVTAMTEASLLATKSFLCTHRADLHCSSSGKRVSEAKVQHKLKYNGHAGSFRHFRTKMSKTSYARATTNSLFKKTCWQISVIQTQKQDIKAQGKASWQCCT